MGSNLFRRRKRKKWVIISIRVDEEQKNILKGFIDEDKGLYFLSDVVREAIREYLKKRVDKAFS